MFTIEKLEDEVIVYNDGILILEAGDILELRELINSLVDGNNDKWEIETLGRILYNINNNLSTMEVV